MSDKPISVGDLVMIVRGHACQLSRRGGVPFTVASIHPPVGGGWRCPHCGAHSLAPMELGAEFETLPNGYTPLSWLKRIPPSEELTGTSEDARKPVKETA